LQTEKIDVAQLEHVRIGAAVGQMAGVATIGLDGLVLVDEWALLVGVTFEADSILRRGSPYLFGLHGAVDIMAIAALDQALIDAMMEGHFKLGFLLEVASVAELGLRFLQKELVRLRVVGRVARGAANVVLGVLGVYGVHVLRTTDVAGEAASVDILGRGLTK
jgi:hypothetical protein